MPTTQREIRYLTTEQLTRLRRHAEARALQAREKGTVGAVRIPQELKAHLKAFLVWKRGRGEDVSDTAPVFTGQRGALTRKSRSSAGKCCESLTHFLSTTECLATAWPTR